jgi:hypothetical protein
MPPGRPTKISPRLKDALMADRIMTDEDQPDWEWMDHEMKNPEEWTRHLGRQMGMIESGDEYWQAGAHDTLILLIPELDRIVGNWPPPTEATEFEQLAHVATKDLSPLELYSTLLAGPPRWRRAKLHSNRSVDQLPEELQPVLEREFASSLAAMVARWSRWDIRTFSARRKEERAAVRARDEAEHEAAAQARRAELRERKLTDRVKEHEGYFQPLGKTY